VAVASRQQGLDPVGATVGQRGTRVQAVVAELGGEKIDVIEWSEDASTFVAKALSPAQVIEVRIDEEHRIANVVVPERMLSLAIGREGQNARLAAKLTGWRIDIRSDVSVAEAAKAEAEAEGRSAETAATAGSAEATAGAEAPESTVVPETEPVAAQPAETTPEAPAKPKRRKAVPAEPAAEAESAAGPTAETTSAAPAKPKRRKAEPAGDGEVSP
jgi:hypothetical protein